MRYAVFRSGESDTKFCEEMLALFSKLINIYVSPGDTCLQNRLVTFIFIVREV